MIHSVEEKIILGIDPGTNLMGYGVLKVFGNKASFVAFGVEDFRKISDPYLKLKQVYVAVIGLIEKYLPDELSIESQFYGVNPQTLHKLGRAQGVAIVAALMHDIPVAEYAPLKIKMAITGNGSATKGQVADMVCRLLNIPVCDMPQHLDATDALAAAYCHFLQYGCPESSAKYSDWKDFVVRNPSKIKI
ncbi:MAG: crossover junction endodeoxyribonuclease RuvC [Candidatus Aphodosoma sp.]